MKRMTLGFALAAVMAIPAAKASDGGPLIDALVKKGVLSSQEGEEIRTEMLEAYSETPGGMIEWGSSAVKGVKIYGDVRFRYQWENAQEENRPVPSLNGDQNDDRSRYRYRLRVGADYQFAENWKGGIRLETASASDSTNANYGGYFDKTGDQVYVGLAYLEYENTDLFDTGLVDYVNLRMGKHKNPFLISSQWWDSDINPEGFSEQIGWEDAGISGLNIALRGGQYIVSEEDNRNQLANGSGLNELVSEDGWLFAGQLEFNYEWASKTGATVAPMFLWESNGTFLGQENLNVLPDNEGAYGRLGNFLAIMLPAEVYFNAWGLPHKFYGTVGVNLMADQWADEFHTDPTSPANPLFWNVGYSVGSTKAKGNWEFGAEYRYIGADSYTPNLSDSDFAKNANNQQGVAIKLGYALTDNIVSNVTWLHSNNITDTPAFNTFAGAEYDTVDLLQVDLNWKF
jgi:hypothetical protein